MENLLHLLLQDAECHEANKTFRTLKQKLMTFQHFPGYYFYTDKFETHDQENEVIQKWIS